MRKIASLLLVGCLMAAVSGCGNPNATFSQGQIPEVTVDEDLVVQGISSVMTYDVTYSVLAPEQAKAILIKDKPIASEQTGGGANETFYSLETSDGLSLTVGSTGSISLRSDLSRYVDTLMGLRGPELMGSAQVAENLPFASQDSALKKVKEILRRLGFDSFGVGEVFALPHELAIELEESLRTDSNYQSERDAGRLELKGTWSEADDCYYIMIDTAIDGIPVIPEGFFSDQSATYYQGGRIEALVSKDGLMGLRAARLYTTVPNTGELQEIIAPDEALRLYREGLEGLISTSSYELAGVSLYYVPQYKDSSHEGIYLLPAWRLEIIERLSPKSNGKGEEYVTQDASYYRLINAVTGQEML